MYGYESDDAPSGRLVFGLNAGAARLSKFEWINNGGKDGAEGEALDITFTVEEVERPINYRLFPVTKAFLPNNGGETIDPKNPAFIKESKEFNAKVIHIMHCFVTDETLKVAFGVPIASFKEYCKILASLLPRNFPDIPLDVFAQYQWAIKGDNKMTFLELPKKMSYGKWICPACTPTGSWKEHRLVDPADSVSKALFYTDDAGNVHPFIKNGWFVNSNFAIQQKDASVESIADVNTEAAQQAQPPVNAGTWGA